MLITFGIDLINVLLLSWIIVFLWKERKRFHSLRPLIPATFFIFLGRFFDLLAEHFSAKLSNVFALSTSTFDLLFVSLGDFSDVVGISFLIYGFIHIIKFQAKEEKLIKNLETMLPLCSYCRKYRTPDDTWMPIEKYLVEMGAPTLTHGVCPECSKKILGEFHKGNPL